VVLFEVKVSEVNVVNAIGKQKRFGQRLGWRSVSKLCAPGAGSND
jgi:ribosomal protein L23